MSKPTPQNQGPASPQAVPTPAPTTTARDKTVTKDSGKNSSGPIPQKPSDGYLHHKK
jgi:hypothetical protein